MFDFRENFYTLAWTTLTFNGDEKSNILVSGGIQGDSECSTRKTKSAFTSGGPSTKKASPSTLLSSILKKTPGFFVSCFFILYTYNLRVHNFFNTEQNITGWKSYLRQLPGYFLCVFNLYL